MITEPETYAARLEIDYPAELNRLTTLLRVIWIIPILIILALLSGSGDWAFMTESGDAARTSGGGVAAGLELATALMIVFRQVYPRWWFNFARELARFSGRVLAYYIVLIILTVLAVLAVVVAWFAILFTGKYPKGLFDFVVGVGRWGLRVQAYAFLLVTDRYPPFRLS